MEKKGKIWYKLIHKYRLWMKVKDKKSEKKSVLRGQQWPPYSCTNSIVEQDFYLKNKG